MAAPHLAQIGGLPGIEPAVRLLGLLQKLAGLRARQKLVSDPSQRRHLLGADTITAGRHHHLMIPLQDRERAAQVRDARKARLKRAIGVGHGAFPRRQTAHWRAT